MSRIANRMQSLAARGGKAVVPYIVAGDPETRTTVEAMHRLVAAGATIIELGVPFSDPMAEGPAIQLGHERALANKVGLKDVLEMVAGFRETDDQTPVVLMGYANPIEAIGYAEFARRAQDAGVDGVLTVDMPPEESGQLNQLLAEVGLDIIYLIAPTTSEERAREICAIASGYIYYVSLKGVTGAGNLDMAEVSSRVNAIKAMTDLPVCVGFGIKDADSAAAISRYADGVVVGSVLVDAMGRAGNTADACREISDIVSDIASGVA